jgi:L-fuculose-phosphate aldolase
MDVQKAKESVVSAGKMLVETGLIARTWGNVSCRIDERRLAITPSGMAYETLSPEDIVIVNIEDLEYEGHIKPSSEKGIHASVYKNKPQINFVIHTHQTNASIAGILGKDVEIVNEEAKNLIGNKAILADYGLPGTKKLRKNVTAAITRSGGRAVLMGNHGALCYGESQEITFEVAKALEAECQRFVTQPSHKSQPKQSLGHSIRKDGACVFGSGDDKVMIDIATGKAVNNQPVSPAAKLHAAIYRAREDVNVIHGTALPYTVSASEKFSDVKPLLDDFAQIIGVTARSVKWDENEAGSKRVVKALKGRNAVLIKGLGALCCTANEDDAIAVEIVMEKGCMAYLSAAAHNIIKPIAPIECLLMHVVYKLKYAKKAAKK